MDRKRKMKREKGSSSIRKRFKDEIDKKVRADTRAALKILREGERGRKKEEVATKKAECEAKNFQVMAEMAVRQAYKKVSHVVPKNRR